MVAGWVYGILVGCLPAVSMLASSLLLMNLSVDAAIEACFQNFCAGLILAAVAGELFPLAIDGHSKFEVITGVTIGFISYMLLFNGIESVIRRMNEVTISITRKNSLRSVDGYDSIVDDEGGSLLVNINDPNNRMNVNKDFQWIANSVELIRRKSSMVLRSNLSEAEADKITEDIDEEMHRLQYMVDRARRRVEGNGAGVNYKSMPASTKADIDNHIAVVSESIEHLLDHVEVSKSISSSDLVEIYGHLEDFDAQLSKLHGKFEIANSPWRRSRVLPEVKEGDTIPLQLFFPVTVDAAVDGFLIGITCGVSPRGGLILGFANCLEMGFLGMAFSCRISKCSGSSSLVRTAVVATPPVVMLLASGLGAFIGITAKNVPIFFITFVAFGIIALLALVCNELVVEAHEGGKDKWWVAATLYLGIYVVILMSLFLPE